MKLRILSDGTGRPGSTQVFNAETGERLRDVERVQFRHRAGDLPQAEVRTFHFPEVDVVAEGHITVIDVTDLDSRSRRFYARREPQPEFLSTVTVDASPGTPGGVDLLRGDRG